MDKYSLHPSTRKPLFATDEDHYKKKLRTNQNKELQSPVPMDSSKTIPTAKALRILQMRG